MNKTSLFLFYISSLFSLHDDLVCVNGSPQDGQTSCPDFLTGQAKSHGKEKETLTLHCKETNNMPITLDFTVNIQRESREWCRKPQRMAM